jgi:post-segregation antitoxin (ccd killing protein)
MTQPTTNSVRIDKDILDKIRVISADRGQTISGYINTNLAKIVERQWQKTSERANKKEGNI